MQCVLNMNNMNLRRALAHPVAADGHEVHQAADIGLAAASDEEILRHAKSEGAVVLRHDLDYGRLLAFSGAEGPSVVIFRLRDTSPANLVLRFRRAWPHIGMALVKGNVVVIEDTAIRLRSLPIAQGA